VTLTGTTYTVQGSHTYKREGVYAVRVTVSYGGASATLRAAALILEDPPHHGCHHHHLDSLSVLYHELLKRLGLVH
jgi:hypothetical protein